MHFPLDIMPPLAYLIFMRDANAKRAKDFGQFHTALLAAKKICEKRIDWVTVRRGSANVRMQETSQANKILNRVILHLSCAMHDIIMSREN
jgi:hypothetical protein